MSDVEKLYDKLCTELGCVNVGWDNLNPEYQHHFINSINNIFMIVRLGSYATNGERND